MFYEDVYDRCTCNPLLLLTEDEVTTRLCRMCGYVLKALKFFLASVCPAFLEVLFLMV